MMYGRGYYGSGACYGIGGFGIWHILILLGVILLSIAMINTWKRHKTIRMEDSSLQILREKFANGEITEEEYLNKISILNKK